MNRKERRATVARGQPIAAAPTGTGRLFAEANQAYREGHFARAEALCRQIAARAPAHSASLNLLGLIDQARDRHRPAVKMFAQAIAADEFNAACYYNIASSYQLLHEGPAAAAHFKKAIALGLSGQDVGDLLLQNPVIAGAVQRAMTKTPEATAVPFDDRGIEAIANDVFLQCALQSTLICGVRFEFLFTHLRRRLLRLAEGTAFDPAQIAAPSTKLFCALAQQCFINEYAFLQTDQETERSGELRQLLVQKLSDARPLSPLLVAAIAAYYPLYSIPGTPSLLAMQWPDYVAELLRQQISEPLAEAEDRRAIPALTIVEDATSLEVRRQYEENPYPRWTMSAVAAPIQEWAPHAHGSRQADGGRKQDILIAACGTGRHAVDVAQHWRQADILAVDLSRASLAYARKKTREAGIGNIEYAQADILKLGDISRTFDRIEAIGVLHHLADPKAGWRVLLSLLRPGGTMRVGLYSEIARRAIVEARALVAQRGYPPTAEGVRALRQTIIRDPNRQRWQHLLDTSADFYCTSGCRDLFFNVMEHRFTIPQIQNDLTELGLSFLRFEVDPATAEMFRQRYPGAKAWTNLDHWHAFEMAHTDTFRRMYVFEVACGD